jgi:hypothetical protein
MPGLGQGFRVQRLWNADSGLTVYAIIAGKPGSWDAGRLEGMDAEMHPIF